MTDKDGTKTYVEEHSVKEMHSTIEDSIESSVKHRTAVAEESSVIDNFAVVENNSVKVIVTEEMSLKNNTSEVTKENTVTDNRPVTAENAVKESTTATVTFASRDVRLKQFGQIVRSQSESDRKVIE